MRGESDLLPQQFVVEHQQSSVEYLEFVVPKDVEDLRPRAISIADKSYIIDQYSSYLSGETGVLPLISPQIEKFEIWTPMEFRTVHLIAADEIQGHAS